MDILVAVLKRIFSSNAFKGLSFEEKRRALFLYVFLLIGTLFFFPFVFINIYYGHYPFVFFDVSILVIIGLMIWILFTKKRVNEMTWAVVFSFAAVCLYFYLSGGVEQTGPVFSILIPVICIFLLGTWKGIIFTLVYLVISTLFYLFAMGTDWFPSYDSLHLIRYLIIFINLTIFSGLVELIMSVLSRQLIERNKELGSALATRDRFFTILAHDLKGPLSGLTELLNFQKHEEVTGKSTDLYSTLELAAETANRVNGLLENLLDWGKIQVGRVPFKGEAFFLHESVDDAIALYEKKTEKKEIRIISEVDKGARVYGDPGMIATVLRNLIFNGVKFSGKGDRITITLEEENKFHRIAVSDEGTGISNERQKLLFTNGPVETVKGTSQETGTGLGLIICRQFIELNGGTLDIVSDEGKGTRVSFTVPAVMPEPEKQN